MAAYALPRFMSRQEWESLSLDNLYWLNQTGKWIKFYPGAYDSDWRENWGVINFGHPDNVYKDGEESIYVFSKRVHSDYRKLYGVPEC